MRFDRGDSARGWRQARQAAACLLVALLAGCAAMRLDAPKVSLADLEWVGGNLVEQRFALKLRVRNPNDREIVIRGLDFDVDLNGRPFARGVGDKATTVPRFGEGIVEVAAVSNFGSLLRQIGDLARAGKESLPYRVKGTVLADGFGSIPFDSRGEWKLPQTLRLRAAPEPN